MNTHDKLELPPLPGDLYDLPGHYWTSIQKYVLASMHAAIEADRKRRGEPDWEAIKGKRMCDLSASQQEDARELWLREQWRWFGEGESRPGDHIKFLLDRLDAVRAPQPAEPVNAGWCEGCTPDDCCGCGPHKPAEPVKVPSDEVDLEEVRRYLDDWGCLDHPGVRALLARYGSTTGEATNQQRKIE